MRALVFSLLSGALLASCTSLSESDTYVQASDAGGNLSGEIGERLYFRQPADPKAVKPVARK